MDKKEIMNKHWPGLMKIIEIQHIRDSKVIWRQTNVYNMLHSLGEQFLLNCCFNNNGSLPPEAYYFGLDNRSTISKTQEETDLVDEPIGNGYVRQAVSSNGGFTIEKINNVYRASSEIFSFIATGDGWGPVTKVFMSTAESSGILLSSASLSNAITLTTGDSVNLRMSLSLQDVAS